jgi:hypothetical protein
MTGVTTSTDDGYYLEAWWVANPYLPTDDKFPAEYWAMDLLPACPLYHAIQYSWHMTAAKYATAQYAAFTLKDDPLIPEFKRNLHWSTRALAPDVLATPIDYPTSFRIEDQKSYLKWVESYSLRMEGEVIEGRFSSWFRTHPLNGYQTHE